MPPAVEKLFTLLREAFAQGTLVKLTLGAARGADPTLRNVIARPVRLRAGPRLAVLFRHTTRDVTRNLAMEEAVAELAAMLGRDFGGAHLFTTAHETELHWPSGGTARLRQFPPKHRAPADRCHDRARARLIEPGAAPWLHALGVTTAEGRVCVGREAKFRQIQKFTEILQHSLAGLPRPPGRPLRLVDMGCGKGYLTFAAYDWLQRAGWEPQVRGVEARAELVALGNRVAQAHGCAGLRFEPGTIATTELESVDVLVALHACDTATDDALAKGVRAGAALILAAPCCHRELRPQLRAGSALGEVLRHGILRERQAELVTDALRAALLEWAGYDTRVFEFIAPEHTAKNLMIAATRRAEPQPQAAPAAAIRELAAFFGLRSQRLARQLGFALAGSAAADVAIPNGA